MKAEIPQGYELLLTSVVSTARSGSVKFSATTAESALSRARHKVPKGAVIVEEKELAAPRSETVLLEAFEEAAAKQELDGRLTEDSKIVSFRLDSEGSKGFLGIGKKPNRYRAELFHPAVVELTYVLKAKVRFTLMSEQAGDEARAAVQEVVSIFQNGAGQADPSSLEVIEPLRAVGYRLESIGGFDLMLAACTLFGRENPDRDQMLREAWNGIGAWLA